jgi:ABC-2 type transport system permease protein
VRDAMRKAANIFWLGTKELRSLSRDFVVVAFIVWTFTFDIFNRAQGHLQEVYNASIAIVDEDNSQLSRRIADAFLPPLFKRPVTISERDVDRLMNTGEFTFVINIPPNFERDVLGGRHPTLQLIADATALTQAGVGSGYAQQIISDEIMRFMAHVEHAPPASVSIDVRIAYNPNANPAWFVSMMGILDGVTMLSIILAGAAVVREREHGTMDHLLVMPLTPFEIAMSKVWANGLVILVTVAFSVYIVIQTIIGVPIAGSIPLFLCGTAIYLFFATAIGIFLGTVARSMPQLGLLIIFVALPMNMLSGANTPLESMPPVLAMMMRASPSTHFVSLSQSILYRGAGFDVVWPQFLIIAVIGAIFLELAILRFQRVTAQPG